MNLIPLLHCDQSVFIEISTCVVKLAEADEYPIHRHVRTLSALLHRVLLPILDLMLNKLEHLEKVKA